MKQTTQVAAAPKKSLFGFLKKNKEAAVAPKKKEVKIITPDIRIWNTITTILMLMTIFWHLEAASGWMNGTTMVEHYGMDPILANAVAACPDILFYATHAALGVSLIMLVITSVLFYRYVIGETEGHDALLITMICSIIAVWAFPFLHAITDLTASAAEVRDSVGVIRDTRLFDVFQLGIEGWPLMVTTGVCCVVLWVNRRVNILT